MMGSEAFTDATSTTTSSSSTPHNRSLREEAQQRANELNSGGHTMTTPAHQQQQQQTSTNTYRSPHPLQTPFASPPPSSAQQLASQARSDWRKHGVGLSQVYEDKRNTPNNSNHTTSSAVVSVRVISAETKVDAGGAEYTAYIMTVQNNSLTTTTIHHRYGEFHKLHTLLQQHNIHIATLFPSKSMLGRLGNNWTPSLVFGGKHQHDELVQYRQIQLDLWMVDVVNLYNTNQLPDTMCVEAVSNFLFHADQPPCHNVNTNTTSANSSSSWMSLSNPLSFTLGGSIRQAASIVKHMTSSNYFSHDQSIPLDLLHQAKGLCFLTVVKAGVVLSGKVGTGCMISKSSDLVSWSAPCALGTVGLGWGAQIGGDITDYLIILTTQSAVQSFISSDHSIHLGAELNVAVGPIGRGAQMTSSHTLQPAYAYAHSSGLFVGVSLEGSVVNVRHDVNSKFYGRRVSPSELLLGTTIGPPRAAEPLYQALKEAMQATIPEGGIRPSQILFGASSISGSHGAAAGATTAQTHHLPSNNTTNSSPAGHASMFNSTSS